MNSLQRNKVNQLIKLILSAILEVVEEEICVIGKKKLWIRKWIDRRDKLGATNCLLKELALEDPKEYFDNLRMSESCVNFLLMKIQSQIQRENTLLRSAIPAITKLQAVLYFLATGCSLRTLTHMFRLGKSTISEFIIEVCEAIYELLKEFIKIPTTTGWKKIENGFREQWNFPGCCGAIDGKHVVIKAPLSQEVYTIIIKRQTALS
ncbi:uncharacterized protein LOC130446982 [Diorhabda sublineata]|uniref:uncharacterized protein LOC130446982 n=1 Tax=Diorhabda sublineata TaxID=1163346 RepID=UPI0024E086E9|nr:uncharacterized protein LOC130446982 [Diorhabda sublineata]